MKPLVSQALEKFGKNWSIASLTREGKIQSVKDFVRFVAKTYALENIQNLKSGHVTAYVQNMKDREMSNGTMCNRMTAVRELSEAIGKGNIVLKSNADYSIERGSRQNPIDANREKIGEIREKLGEIAATGNAKAIMCLAAVEMREAFGLRAKESLMSHKIVNGSKGPSLFVEGSKGGRPREVEIRTDQQIRALQLVAAAAQAVGSKTGRIIPPDKTLEQAYNIQRTMWAKLGGTRVNAAHMHSERHAYTQDLKSKGYTNAQIMAELGHGEQRSPGAYIPK